MTHLLPAVEWTEQYFASFNNILSRVIKLFKYLQRANVKISCQCELYHTCAHKQRVTSECMTYFSLSFSESAHSLGELEWLLSRLVTHTHTFFPSLKLMSRVTDVKLLALILLSLSPANSCAGITQCVSKHPVLVQGQDQHLTKLKVSINQRSQLFLEERMKERRMERREGWKGRRVRGVRGGGEE